MILPTANMRLAYEGIGIYVDDWSFAIVFFMNFELGVLFLDEKTTTLSRAYEGLDMFVDDWKKNPITLLGGHGNRKIVQYGLPGSHKIDDVNLKVAEYLRSLLVN
jgi:hypothetical protein